MYKYLTLYPDTFFWRNKYEGLIYNSQNYMHYKFEMTLHIKKIFDHLNVADNLYSYPLSTSEYKILKKWLTGIENIDAGKIHEENDEIASYIPRVRVYNDIDAILDGKRLGTLHFITDNLCELTIHINGDKRSKKQYYKQTKYPYNFKHELTGVKIIEFIEKCTGTNLTVINLIGDLDKYKDFGILIDYLSKQNYNVNIYVLEDAPKITNFPINEKFNIFYLSDQKDYITYKDSLGSIIEKRPVFNGKNFDFFRSKVFTSISDIEDQKLNKRLVFANQLINSNYWGKLAILPNSEVYSGFYFEKLGTLSMPLYDLIFNEFKQQKAWFSIRNGSQCIDCIYRWLCPPPSNYEFELKQTNLCTIYLK